MCYCSSLPLQHNIIESMCKDELTINIDNSYTLRCRYRFVQHGYDNSNYLELHIYYPEMDNYYISTAVIKYPMSKEDKLLMLKDIHKVISFILFKSNNLITNFTRVVNKDPKYIINITFTNNTNGESITGSYKLKDLKHYKFDLTNNMDESLKFIDNMYGYSNGV